MDDPALGGIDVESIERIDRSGDDGRVRWSMTCEADTRTADLGDFTDD